MARGRTHGFAMARRHQSLRNVGADLSRFSPSWRAATTPLVASIDCFNIGNSLHRREFEARINSLLPPHAPCTERLRTLPDLHCGKPMTSESPLPRGPPAVAPPAAPDRVAESADTTTETDWCIRSISPVRRFL